jgi:hypothetical protein
MDKFDIIRMLSCFSVPLGFWAWWIWARLGRDKRWFVAPMPLISRNFYFALPTAMLGGFFIAIDIVLGINDPNSTPVFSFIAFGLWGASFVIAYFEPDWMSPEWYRWLKREHGDIMPYLVLDAHEMGRQEWMRRVQTQVGLEEWAAEVRRKHRL